MTQIPDAERLARLRLVRTDGIGPVGYGQLLRRHGDAVAAIAALEDARKAVAGAETSREFAQARAIGARHIFLGEADYPPLLAELQDPPPMLLMMGDAGLARRPVVGIVGARNASAVGRALAARMAAGLGEAGFVVASGLARGIDRAVHEGSLASGTIGCVAGGLDIAYPPEHAELQPAIGRDGLLISTLPPGTEPQARHFPRRNRLIAGVARALVVIEAAAGSGSLITARLAAEAGRDVMAVPGHPSDPRSRGGNGLLKDGAILVEDAADVIAALSPFVPVAAPAREKPRRVPELPLAPARAPAGAGDGELLELLTVSGIAVDELVRASGRPAAEVQAALSDLELEGRVLRLAGGRVALAA